MTPRHAVVGKKLQVGTALGNGAITTDAFVGERIAAIQMTKASSIGGTARSRESQGIAFRVEFAGWLENGALAAIE